MSNELLLLGSALLDILCIILASRKGVEYLYSIIVLNLILVGIFGSKLISVFGFSTNAGNVFYACVFLATHSIVEMYGKKAGLRTLWLGVISVVIFTLLSQSAILFNGLHTSDITNTALTTIFTFSTRIVIASLLAFIFAQYINVSIYQWIKNKTDDRYLWLRINGANIVSQFIDSLLFFSIAFFDIPDTLLVQTILVGWMLKTAVVALGTPLVYINNYLIKK